MSGGLLLPIAGIALVALCYIIVTTLTSRRPSVMLSVLGLLSISPQVFSFDLDWVQKALAAVVVLLLIARRGIRPDLSAWTAIGIFTVSLVFAVTPHGGPFGSPSLTAVRAWAGYTIPWLFLLVRWRPADARDVLRAVMYLAPLSIPLGFVLQVAGLWAVLPSDGTSIRLGGATIPATLALSGVVGVFAASLELTLFAKERHAAVWLLINLVIVVGTITRGAMIAAAIVVIGLGAWSFTRSAAARPRSRRVARSMLVVLVVLVIAVLPGLIARSAGNSYEGAFNTSGREQAWPFYFDIASSSPWIGRGLGFATIAIAIYAPIGVQELTAPHNEYLHLAVDGGLFLLLGFMVLLAIAFTAAARGAGPGARIVVLFMAPALLIYAASDNPFSTPQFLIPFVVVLSALAALRRPQVEPGAADPTPRAVRAPTLIDSGVAR